MENDKKNELLFDYPDSDDDIMDLAINAVHMDDIEPELIDRMSSWDL
jgi:hypothetical protein